MADDNERFDWSSDNIVVPEQKPIAVYWNPLGALVIRQQAGEYEREDPFVVIQPSHIPALLSRIEKLLSEGPSAEE